MTTEAQRHRRREAKAKRRRARLTGTTRAKRTPLVRAMERAALAREGQERILKVSAGIATVLRADGVRLKSKQRGERAV